MISSGVAVSLTKKGRVYMKKLMSIFLVASVMMFFMVTPVLAKTKWNANSVWPPKNQHSVGLEEFAKKVNAATKGELELVVHSGGALGYKGPELLKVVRDGLVPVSDMLISPVSHKIFRSQSRSGLQPPGPG